jgi:transposase
MNGYSEDLRRKIVSAVERGMMSKTQAARTFDVSLSSVKRYANKAGRGESLVPKKSPGSAPKLDEKANKLLEDDLGERPFVSLQDRCDYMETVTGLFVSRSCSVENLRGSVRYLSMQASSDKNRLQQFTLLALAVSKSVLPNHGSK